MPASTATLLPSDAFLFKRIAGGDVQAYDVLYRRHHRSALAVAKRVCGRRADAEGVVQEAFLAIWRQASRYTPASGSAGGWIASIVRNRAIDALRRQARIERVEASASGCVELLAYGASTDREVVRRERAQAVHGAIRRLPPAQFESVVLTHFRGLSHEAVARRVGRPLGTVKGRVRLGHAKLREELAGVAS